MSDWYAIVQDYVRRREPVATVTIVRGDPIGAKVIIGADNVEGEFPAELLDRATILAREAIETERSGIHSLADGIDVFVEVFPVSPLLLIVGAVHVAQAIVPIARSLGFHVVVADARQQLATAERFPDVDELIVGWPDEIFAKMEITKTSAICILTHDPKFDEPALLAALETDAAYIGAVGSRKTNADRRERLKAAGVDDEQLARIHGPIGLDIGGKRPEEMVISILAEIISVQNGRTGASLHTTTGAIRAL